MSQAANFAGIHESIIPTRIPRPRVVRVVQVAYLLREATAGQDNRRLGKGSTENSLLTFCYVIDIHTCMQVARTFNGGVIWPELRPKSKIKLEFGY